MNEPKVIDQMFAFVVIDEDGDESVPAILNKNTWLPLVGADLSRIESLMEPAQVAATQLGKPIKIYRFSVREEIGEVKP